MDGLAGQVALVTGGGSGIGAAIAESFAGEGASIVLTGRRGFALEEVARRLPGPVHCAVGDVRDPVSGQALVAAAIERFGRLDVLVNSAGIFKITPFPETSLEFWDDVLDTNLRGAYVLSHAAWPHLQATRGQIVNISSVAGTRGFAGSSAYCASKHGLNGLSEVLALEGRPHGIRVFAVCPGAVETAIWAEEDAATRAKMMRSEDVAELVRWLVLSPRGLGVGPVVIDNFVNPWAG
ncbi:MAG TPA: SDR family oxidoreductase [Fimbriimonadaceae bacterium]|nr:SDR family oxidoreductase [Fimbriimonadaceae bacterium]